MRILYLDCRSGVAGDMVLGALADAVGIEESMGILESIGIPEVRFEVGKTERSHITGTKVRVVACGKEEHQGMQPHGHSHRSLADVLSIIESLNVPESVRRNACDIYRRIALAESEVHGKDVSEVHFHEVGMLDAIADIVGVCAIIDRIRPDSIVCSPIRTGFGSVVCAHGVLPVPAPATAILLKGIPAYSGDDEGEFATPTGVALMGHFAESFGGMPEMTASAIGNGFGTRDSGRVNMVRAFIGEASERLPSVVQMDCTIDDMTPEDLASASERLFAYGALDVTVSPVMMKKGRPGFLLSCICRPEDTDRLARGILAETSTIGVRFHECQRYEMRSHQEVCATQYGDIRVKVSEGFGIVKRKPEHDDLVHASQTFGVPLDEVRRAVLRRRPLGGQRKLLTIIEIQL